MPSETSPTAAVIVRAGRNSTHAGWLTGAAPAFDLIVAAYEPLPAALAAAANHYILLPGYKVGGWSELFARHPELLTRYTHVALIDDDIICSADDINKSFELGCQYGLSLWQPSLAWGSHFTYGVVLHNPGYILRFTNFVEMMCPFFATPHLITALPFFAMGYETGIDLLWCRLRPDWHEAYAVLDAVQILHSRPVGLKKADQGFTTNYRDVIGQVLDRFGLDFHGPVAYAGITRNGCKIHGRWRMAWHALALLRAISHSPDHKWASKAVTDHIRHNLIRPIGIDRTQPGALATFLESRIK